MLNPAYKITIGKKVVDTTDEPQASTVVELSVSLDMNTAADSANLILGNVNGLKPACDDETTIELGYADNGGLTQVMAGTVIKVTPGLLNTEIYGFNAAHTLLHSFLDKTYESKKAGQIVQDLAQQAGVKVAKADYGINFPAYVIDGRRSFFLHMRDLADLCGFDLYLDSNNELVFKKFISGNTVHVFDYAKHILKLSVKQIKPFAKQVEAWGESPGGSQAPEAWPWLTKDFSGNMVSAGSGDEKLLLENPLLRDGKASQTAAAAALTDIDRNAVQGRMVIAGNADVKLGDAVRIREVPNDDLNDTFQVRAIKHRITKREGFITSIGFRSI